MMTRRSTGKTRMARALWYPRKGAAELRLAPLPRPRPGEAMVRTLFSGISRGTERLVFTGPWAGANGSACVGPTRRAPSLSPSNTAIARPEL